MLGLRNNKIFVVEVMLIITFSMIIRGCTELMCFQTEYFVSFVTKIVFERTNDNVIAKTLVIN